MINPKCVEVFLSIVAHKSISAVAKNTYLSQPTVSEYLNQLEQALGTTLINRGKGQRQITLTPAGEAFLPLAEKWMAHQQELETQIRRFKQNQTHNVLRLAASSGAHQHVASHIACKLLENHPDIHLQLSNVERREMPDAIENDRFDIAFLFGKAPASDHIRHIPLFEEDQYILCPADTVLPDRLLCPEDLDPGFFVPYAAYRNSETFMQWYADCFQGAPMTTMLEASSLASIHHYLNDPRSWTIVPASIAMADIAQQMKHLTYRKIMPEPPKRNCSLLVAKSYTEEVVTQAFLDCCRAYIHEREYLQNL